ncbi:MAG TPA: MATE family efflux transporter, partial [Clostridium sp.]|nr:MATE family efflux transporter [Clostridium sp.]
MSGMFLQNIGRFKEATIVSAARQGIIFIPLILFLPNIWGLYGIMLVQPLSDIGTFIISLPMSIKEVKKLNG